MSNWNAEDIKSLRTRLGLSQAAFAERVGVTTNYIYMLEKGVKTASKTLMLLLDCVNEKEKGGSK